MRTSGSVCVWESGWYTGGHLEYVDIGLDTWWGCVCLVGWRSGGSWGQITHGVSRPLGSQNLILSPTKFCGLFWAPSQSGHSPARDTLKVSGVHLYVPERGEAET